MPGWRARSSRRPRRSKFLTPGMPCSVRAHHSFLPCRSAAAEHRSVVPSPGQLRCVKHSRQLLSHTHRTQATVSWRLQPASAVLARSCSAVSLFCSSRLSPRAVCWRKSVTPWCSSLSGRQCGADARCTTVARRSVARQWCLAAQQLVVSLESLAQINFPGASSITSCIIFHSESFSPASQRLWLSPSC